MTILAEAFGLNSHIGSSAFIPPYARKVRKKGVAGALGRMYRRTGVASVSTHAFVVNLPGIDRSTVTETEAVADLLWFATGGKTKACRGLRHTCLPCAGTRDIEGIPATTVSRGADARYTLRLLTLQQFQRCRP